MSDSICTVIVNFQTPDLLEKAVNSFRRFYQRVPILIIDNGSKDDSRVVILKLQNLAPTQIQTLFLDKNIYHGPAMHSAIQKVSTKYVFFLDSDTETHRGGFIEKMLSIFNTSDRIYGVGRTLTVNKRGFPAKSGMTLLAPAYMMIQRELYHQFSPFKHHGMPIMKNFIEAQMQGYTLEGFDIEKYIEHRWRGTASKFGYGLGWRGKVDFILNKLGI